MSTSYDKYYQTENLFGEPYPELIAFFSNYPNGGRILDLGCGQGRDAIALAREGFQVTGLDHSRVGIEQLNAVANAENLTLRGITADIFTFDDYSNFDFILLDSMFHFAKNDREKETRFIQQVLLKIDDGCIVVFCIQDSGEKVKILEGIIDGQRSFKRLTNQKFKYTFEDNESGHKSAMDYRMIVVKK